MVLMRRLKVLGFAAAFVLLMAGSAFAADVKANGYWWMEAVNRSNWNFGAGNTDEYAIEQKLRTSFTFTANENLRGILDTQIGTDNWGHGSYGIGAGRTPSYAMTGTVTGATASTVTGSNASGAGNIMLRKAYIEYKWPGTNVNVSVGFQTLTLPAAFGGGSPVLDDQMAAAVVSAPITQNVSLLAGYARPFDANGFGATSATNVGGSATDVVLAALPISTKEFTISPYGMFLYSGAHGVSSTAGGTSLTGLASANSTLTDGLRGYWGGAALTVTPEGLPLKVMADFDYGRATYTNYANRTTGGGRAGWMADLAVDYTGSSLMTPEAFFVFSSGESGRDTDKSGRMPVVALPQNWTIGSFFFGERYELTGFINSAGYTERTLGYWATGISLKDITFIDKLSHTVNILYARGTNDPDFLQSAALRGIRYAGFLTKKDSLWEVDLNTRYKFYDELTGYIYLGFVNSHFDKDVWTSVPTAKLANARITGADGSSGNAYKIGVGLNYFF
jgi:hypothetical protein